MALGLEIGVDVAAPNANLLENVVEDTAPQLGGNLNINGSLFVDSNGNEILGFSETASAVNYLDIYNNITGFGPQIRATGSDTNVSMALWGKGAGTVNINSPKLVVGSDADGDLYYRSSGKVDRLGIGSAGQSLITNSGGTAPEWGSGIVTETSKSANSGTLAFYDAIPSWVSEVNLMIRAVSTDAAGDLLVTIGPAAGIETSGYVSSGAYNGSGASSTAGFLIRVASAGRAITGTMTLRHFGGNTWVASFVGNDESATSYLTSSGQKNISGALQRIRISPTTGNLDGSGSINIAYS